MRSKSQRAGWGSWSGLLEGANAFVASDTLYETTARPQPNTPWKGPAAPGARLLFRPGPARPAVSADVQRRIRRPLADVVDRILVNSIWRLGRLGVDSCRDLA